jgi:acyl carrier protein phosphodiesterase
MNVLCHLALAGRDPNLQTGQFLGDFCKGYVEQLPYSPEILQGIRDHRRIDALCDAHNFARTVKSWLPPQSRRYGGIALDVFCDWLLHENWDQLIRIPKTEALTSYHGILIAPQPDWPDDAKHFARILCDHRILEAYANLSEIRYTLSRIGQRLRKPVDLSSYLDIFLKNEAWFHTHFPAFFQELLLPARRL